MCIYTYHEEARLGKIKGNLRQGGRQLNGYAGAQSGPGGRQSLRQASEAGRIKGNSVYTAEYHFHEPCRHHWSADILGLDRTTLNRNLKPLEGKELIRSGSGKDPRTRTLKLTKEGTKILQNALPLWLEAQTGDGNFGQPHQAADG